MTAKEFVRKRMPKAMSERHVEGRIVGKPYWLIRDGRSTMYFTIGKTESNALVNAKNKIIEQDSKYNTIDTFDIFFQTVIISVVFILIVLFIIFIVTKIKDYYRERT